MLVFHYFSLVTCGTLRELWCISVVIDQLSELALSFIPCFAKKIFNFNYLLNSWAMINVQDFIRNTNLFKKFEVDDLLFAEIICPVEEDESASKLWWHNNFFSYAI